jgi:hypothetical protein
MGACLFLLVAAVHADDYSNIRPEDYVGPAECGSCHAENYLTWRQHPHSRMNQLVSPEAVVGDFSDVRVDYAGRTARFYREGDDFFVEHLRGDAVQRRIRVTRLIGWRYEQDLVGVQVVGPEPPDDPLYRQENRVRFSWSIDQQRWLPQSYLEPTEYPGPEYRADGSLTHDPFAPERVPFTDRCARCHNTYSYDLRLYRMFSEDGMVTGFPPGSVTPADIGALARERGDAARLTTQHLPPERFVTVGISCESCHFGGREHAADGSTPISFVPRHPRLGDWPADPEGARRDPAVINAICRQCHHSGLSAPDNWPDGSAAVNSMEAAEMDRGGCVEELRCTACHNTHVSGPNAGAPDRPEHLATCVACHDHLATADAAQAHSGHDAGDASCLDCHMPRIVQSFAVYNRTHRISSPSEPEILATGMPNACNLCHLDESLAWTRDRLVEGWGTRVDLSPALRPHFGADFERPAGQAWLTHPFSMARTVAAGAFARSALGDAALPRLTAHLDEPNAYVRLRFLMAVERILGRNLLEAEYSLLGPPEHRRAQVRQLQAALTTGRP